VRLHVTTDDADDRNYGRWFVDYLAARAAECPFRVHTLTGDPDAADAVLVIVRGDEYSTELRRGPLVRAYYPKLFVYDTKDRPIPFLPGLYCSLPRSRFDLRRHAAAPYLAGINPAVDRAAERAAGREPDLLFSFVGASNAPVRRRLFRQGWAGRADVHLEVSYGWANRGGDAGAREAREEAYADLLLRSRFVLCPRGIGTSSYRLYETMQLGRVPVILSDAWVPPAGPEWNSFSVRLPERSVGNLPELLAAYAERSAEMGRLARSAWEEWFAPRIIFHRFAEALDRLRADGRSHPRWARAWWPVTAGAARVYRTLDRAARAAAKAGLRLVRNRGATG
jgi:Exostosin family